MKATAILTIAASVLSAPIAAQIPERAQWEITFAQVEAAAELSNLRTAPPATVEARVMQRPWSAFVPLPFLRIVRTDGTAHAQLFVFWTTRQMPRERQPTGADVRCRDAVCVRPIELTEQLDWEAVVADLAHENACPTETRLRNGVPVPPPVCADCLQVWIKTAVDGTYREQSCPEPRTATPADVLLQVMKRSARMAGY